MTNRNRLLSPRYILATIAALVSFYLVFVLVSHTTVQAKARRIVLVEIDKTTIGKYGPWPFAPQLIGETITSLRKANPAVLVVGVTFIGNRVTDEPIRQALRFEGSPVVLPGLDPGERQRMSQPFNPIPPVYTGIVLAQGDATKLKVRESGSAVPHFVVVAACLVLKIDRCVTSNTHVTLTRPAESFDVLKFQDILEMDARQREVRLSGKVVIFGSGRGLSMMQAKGSIEPNEVEFFAQGMLTLLSQGKI